MRLLNKVYGVSRKDLIAFSSGGNKFSHDVVLASYLVLMKRLSSGGDLQSTVSTRRTILQSVMRDYHIFRGGQEYKTSGDSVKKYYQDVIKVCREEREKNRQERIRRKITESLTGKRVSVSGDVWGLSSDVYYIGVIGRMFATDVVSPDMKSSGRMESSRSDWDVIKNHIRLTSSVKTQNLMIPSGC